MKRQDLLDETPKMDTAIKSFASYLVASREWSLEDALTVSRRFSKHLNQHIVSIVTAAQQEQIAQVWNDLIAGKQKVTKHLGRTALLAVWEDLDIVTALSKTLSEDDELWNEKVACYVDLFHTLLQQHSTGNMDSHLIWDADGGAAELDRRAAQRLAEAQLRQQRQSAAPQQQMGPIIEELTGEEE